jgi:hypothetical protein
LRFRENRPRAINRQGSEAAVNEDDVKPARADPPDTIAYLL